MPGWEEREVPGFPQPPDPAGLSAVVRFLGAVPVLIDFELSHFSTLTHQNLLATLWSSFLPGLNTSISSVEKVGL